MKSKISKKSIIAIPIVLGLSCIICSTLFSLILTTLDFSDLPYGHQTTLCPDENEIKDVESPKTLRTIAENDDSLELLWSRSGIRMTKDANASIAAAAKGILFYIRFKAQSVSEQEVVALDANDGQTMLWCTDNPGLSGPSVIDTTSFALVVGGMGVGKVVSYDLQTGERLWSKSYPFQRTVTHLKVVDDLVYVRTVGNGQYILHADTGKSIPFWWWIFTPNASNKYFVNRTLTEDTEFKTGPGRTISARDRQTDELLWLKEALSNAVVSESAVYMVTAQPELKLVGVEPRSGEIITTVTFEPRSAPDFRTIYDYPHRLALDKELRILYVLFRDSDQIFAFKITDYPGN